MHTDLALTCWVERADHRSRFCVKTDQNRPKSVETSVEQQRTSMNNRTEVGFIWAGAYSHLIEDLSCDVAATLCVITDQTQPKVSRKLSKNSWETAEYRTGTMSGQWKSPLWHRSSAIFAAWEPRAGGFERYQFALAPR